MQGLNLYAIKTVCSFVKPARTIPFPGVVINPFSSDFALIRHPFYYSVRADFRSNTTPFCNPNPPLISKKTTGSFPPFPTKLLKLRPPAPPSPPLFARAKCRSSECDVYSSVLVVVDVVEVNVIMGAGMDSLVVDVVEVSVIMGAGMHSLVSCFGANNSSLTVVELFIRML